ncbi:glycoside hydrolase domain-containing protein [Arthrobacter sp. 35W]|uniref:glycoside hydrolase domain-containing protein n=1 Tax=Arthrobacter sp. 35W TaxID=1132441 RepID=UPI00040363BF|nr:glycoside hydrolase domain-containing protein [Arthrobacter sp. 35W]
MPDPATATLARLHPELDCGTGEWDKLLYGNHRIVVQAPDAAAATVVLPWRRQDADPAAVDVIVTSAASGRRVSNVLAGVRTAEQGEFTFEPIDGAGTYYFHYLPYAMGGHAHYPQASYLPHRPTADPAWVDRTATSIWDEEAAAQTTLPRAKAVRYEAASEWDSFAPMNFTPTAAELEVLHAAHAGEPFLLFPENRRHPISLRRALPAHWAIGGPHGTIADDALPGEDYVVQLGLYAQTDLAGAVVTVESADASGHCLNTTGVDRLGRPMAKTLNVPAGEVQGLYIPLHIPAEAAGTSARATITVTAATESGETFSATVAVELAVAAEPDADILAGGHGDPRLLRRLAWLDSTLVQDNELVAPYTAVELDNVSLNGEAATLRILGRSLQLGANGLPAQLTSTFTPAVTGTDGPERALLAEPAGFLVGINWQHSPLEFTVNGPASVAWTCRWTSVEPPLSLVLEGELEADGAATFALRLANPGVSGTTVGAAVELDDAALSLVLNPDAVPYAMGLGVPGGLRPQELDWQWNVAEKNQDSLWLGDANIGFQLALRDDSYERPLNTNFYAQKPLVEPASWANRGPGAGSDADADAQVRGGVRLRTGEDAVRLEAYSGPRTLAPGQELNYGFRLLLTPFKPIDPARQLGNRYFHGAGTPEQVKDAGATVINIHHATALAPYINDPLLSAGNLAAYTEQAHGLGLKVKVYNTVRELTAHSPDVLPLLQLGGEIFTDGASPGTGTGTGTSTGSGPGHIWLQEHAPAGYVSAWYAPNVDDISVVTAGESRWQNAYIKGLSELVRSTGLDGIYLDDIAYDRHTMKRVRKVLQQHCPAPEIDIHSANQFNVKDGFSSSANLYLEQLPYTDRLWLGEYFDYDASSAAYWLVEVSGIPFGLMGEMLEGGGNPWRGMVFGMTGRAPRVDNRPLWAFWTEHGLETAPMVGWWAGNGPVKTNHPAVLATSWSTPKGLVVALASWADEAVEVQLEFDDGAASLAGVERWAPAIEDFQGERRYAPQEGITVSPQRGVLLVIGTQA